MRLVNYASALLMALPTIATANTRDNAPTAGLADTSRVHNLDEVVIVAQPKENLSLRRQPISSSIFTSREMGDINVRELSDLSRHVPSFSMPSYGSRLTSSMYIRGIGSRVNSPAVGIYSDGIPLVSKGSFNFHTYQLKRVDILRGPQGTLYGMNTEGGLVRMYSKSPIDYQGTELRLGIATKMYRNVELSHYAKINDKVAFSLAGFYNGQNGFFRNATTGERADNYDEAGGKARLVLRPSHRTTIDFMVDYQFVRQNGFAYGVLDTADNSVSSPAGNRDNGYRRNMLNTGVNISTSGDIVALNSTTSYQFLDDRMDMDQDYLPEDYMHLSQTQLMNAVTQEFTLKSLKEGKWHWTSGVYGSYQWLKTAAPVFFDDDFTARIASPVQTAMYNAIVSSMASKFAAQGMTEEAARQQAAAVVDRAGGVGLGVSMDVPSLFRTPQFNLGVFHESTIDLADRLKATLGLRYDYSNVEIHYDTRAAMLFNANVMGTEATYALTSALKSSKSNHFDQLLPKIGLTYTFDDNGSNVYASLSKGYRAGGYNIQMFSDILQAELNANSSMAMRGDYDVEHTIEDYDNVNSTISYKPETSWNYEFGAHLNLFGNKVHADLSGFYMQIRNQQLSVMAGNYGFGRMMVNAGKSYSCGIEASVNGSAIGNRLSWAVNYGLTHAVFKEYADEVDGESVSYDGNRVPFVPMHTLSASAEYGIGFAHSIVSLLTLGADVTAQGRTYWDEANTYSQPFYALLGIHADVVIKNVGLKVWCRNLTDTRYNTFAFDSSVSGGKTYFAQRGNPIQAGIDATISF